MGRRDLVVVKRPPNGTRIRSTRNRTRVAVDHGKPGTGLKNMTSSGLVRHGDEPTLDGDRFDVIIEGTDLPQCMIAAAMAQCGLHVLILEPGKVYGGRSSGSLSGMQLFGSESATQDATSSESTHCDSQFHCLERGGSNLASIEITVKNDPFVFDLSPQWYFAADRLIDVLIRSGAGAYLLFQPVDAIFTLIPEATGSPKPEALIRVPSSKADVFASQQATFAEKRLLMRLLRICFLASEETSESLNGGFALDASENEREYARQLVEHENDQRFMRDFVEAECKRLMSNASALVPFLFQYVFAMISDEEKETLSVSEGIRKVNLYLRSMVRYTTPTPFLCCKYGSAEIAQAFARRCAVKGGAVALRRGVAHVPQMHFETSQSDRDAPEQGITVITTQNERVKSRYGVVRASPPEGPLLPRVQGVVRFIGVRRTGLFASSDARVVVMAPSVKRSDASSTSQPSSQYPFLLLLKQLDSTTGACPEGFYVVYAELVTNSSRADHRLPESDPSSLAELKYGIERLLAAATNQTTACNCRTTTTRTSESIESAFDAYAFLIVPRPPPALDVCTPTSKHTFPITTQHPYTQLIIEQCYHLSRTILSASRRSDDALATFFPYSPT